MLCQYCGKEILGKPYIVGPKRLGMIYCSPECFWKEFDEKHPELAPKKEWEIPLERFLWEREEKLAKKGYMEVSTDD